MFQAGDPQTRASSLSWVLNSDRPPPAPRCFLFTLFSPGCFFPIPQPRFPHLSNPELELHLRGPFPGPVACYKHISLVH